MSIKVTDLEIHNLKRIKYLHVKPKDGVTLIGGKNASGKSTLIDAVAYTIGGAALHPPQPIRNGEDRAVVRVKIAGDESQNIPSIICTRTFERRADGSIKSELQITDLHGYEAGSPQTMLNDLTGKVSVGKIPIAWRPNSFMEMKPADQIATLLQLANLDLSTADAKIAEKSEVVSDLRREAKTAKTMLDKVVAYPDFVGKEPVDTAPIQAEIEDAKQWTSKHKELSSQVHVSKAKLDLAMNNLNSAEQQIASVERQIRELQAKVESMKAELPPLEEHQQKALDVWTDCCRRETEFTNAQPPDLKVIQQRLRDAEEHNNKIAAEAKRQAEVAAYEELVKAGKKAVAEVEEAKAERRAIIAAAEWPVPGLGFDENGVTLNGLPFEQASSAERMEASVAIGAAINPKLKLLFVREGSLLDRDHIVRLAEIAAKYDAQVFLEVVSDDEAECHVVLKDGEAVFVDPEVAPEPETAPVHANVQV